MGCCKCEEYKWEDPQEVVWEDPADGKGYCVFHAPAERKFSGIDTSELCGEEVFAKMIHKRMDANTYHNFSGTIFPYCVHLEQCIFLKKCNFSFCVFGETVFFEKSFWGRSYSFRKAKFLSSVHFKHCRFDAVDDVTTGFYRTEFYGPAYFDGTDFLGKSNFRASVFYKRGYFRGAQFHGNIDFTEIYANPGNVIIGSLRAESSGNIVISNREVKMISFFDVQWPNTYAPKMTFNGYAINCEELYRALKHQAAEEHDQPQVSRWHFREKLMQLKQMFNNDRSNDLLEAVEDVEASWRKRAKAWLLLLWHRPHWPKLTFTGLYWATSGFGERYIRAGVWLGVLVLLSFLANAIPQFFDWNRLWLSAAANDTMASIPFAKDIPGDGWVRVARGVWQLLIAIQFTLFAFAVRNHFRR